MICGQYIALSSYLLPELRPPPFGPRAGPLCVLLFGRGPETLPPAPPLLGHAPGFGRVLGLAFHAGAPVEGLLLELLGAALRVYDPVAGRSDADLAPGL